jgi:hypothetical protein
MARTEGVNDRFYRSCFLIRGVAAEDVHVRASVQVMMFRKQADEFVGFRPMRE